MKTSRSIYIIFLLFCLASFYSYGTAMMDYFLVYPSRFLIGEEKFIAYHVLLEAAIWPISVIPFLIIIALNGFLLWMAPAQVSKRLLMISFGLLFIDFLSTVLIQAPWNYQLGETGKDIVLMQKITDTNWVRVFLESAQVLVVFLILTKHYVLLAERNVTA